MDDCQLSGNSAAAGKKPLTQIVADSIPAEPGSANPKSESVLVIDVGGTKVKMLVTGKITPHKVRTGLNFTPQRLVKAVRSLEVDWRFAAVSIGFPGLVGSDGPQSEPGNL